MQPHKLIVDADFVLLSDEEGNSSLDEKVSSDDESDSVDEF